MEELVDKGLVKAVGISNFSITKTEHLLQTAKTVPAVSQVECNPYWQQQKLKEYCDSKGDSDITWWYSTHSLKLYFAGITFEAYSPLGNPKRPVQKDDDPCVLDEPVLKEIAEKHKATVAQV